ncbi:hypothetical protein [Brevundimonas sp.]|uniref:hypothetical protein n=1 Tax=Brevundimonas sp. TaxID=1871086 RepID=UPI002D299563|nr:hypothetical protein [Brevundimonas sp.]HYD28870.1 hypothetical protein [Brevundimonas sp.]
MINEGMTQATAAANAWRAAEVADEKLRTLGDPAGAAAYADLARAWAAVAGQFEYVGVELEHAPCPAGSSCYALDEPEAEVEERLRVPLDLLAKTRDTPTEVIALAEDWRPRP